ncbi:amidohydrolase family protein [Arthrobacter sp. AB6]|uniref:amidohydrolase family protein n=1 Tax=Arthrobacter sp. AB6 TaxID=2962570 RepID=UPI0028818805|nr:amidohydrolase family protein [Arthrobacter sp. AB6]MDT0196473.1 amidohydrolase family protein [Arthrobacter sp. AB6]
MELTQGTTVIFAGELIDGTGAKPVRDVAVKVVDGIIAEIGTRETVDIAGAAVIDLTGETLLPGIIDAHMHFFGVPSHQLHRLPKETESYRALRGAGEARKMLLAGITSSKDLGSSVGPDIRRAIDEGHIAGPWLSAAGEFITTTNGTWEYTDLPLEWARQRDIIADGPVAMREIVRRRIRAGANFIKLGLSKGFVDDKYHAWGDDPLRQLAGMTLEEVQAATDEAHAHNVMVSAHCIGETAVNLALDGGVDIVEHGYGISDKTRNRLVERQILVGSTISQLYSHQAAYDEFHYPQWERDVFDRHTIQMRTDFKKGLDAGVRFVLGSDLIGYPTHPQDTAAREFQYAVEWGMDPAEAIVAGTMRGAEALGKSDQIGTIEVGKRADLIATANSPLQDITELQRPTFVMQHGRKIRHQDHIYI